MTVLLFVTLLFRSSISAKISRCLTIHALLNPVTELIGYISCPLECSMFQNNHVRLSDEGVIGYLLIADDAVLSAHINDDQVLTAHILNAQITNAKLAAASVATSIACVCVGDCACKKCRSDRTTFNLENILRESIDLT